MTIICKSSILIVEDKSLTLEDLKETFSNPSMEFMERYGRFNFEVETAMSSEEAAEKLNNAASNGRPYDVLLLDLGLPRKLLDRVDDDPNEGLKILKGLSPRTCSSVVIASVHGDKPWVLIELLRERIVYDFVSKPWDENNENLFMTVVKSLLHVRKMQWLQLARQRAEQWLVVQSREEMADNLQQILSRGLAEINDQVKALRESCDYSHREDPIAGIEETVSLISQQWIEARKKRDIQQPELSEVDLAEIVKKSLIKFWPGVEYRRLNVHLREKEFYIKTFEAEFLPLLDEIVFSAIEASEDRQPLHIHIDKGENNLTARVTVIDQGEPIDNAICKRIARGEIMSIETKRAHGLCLAQRIAHNLAGGINVIPASNGTGNTITLDLPLVPYEIYTDSRK